MNKQQVPAMRVTRGMSRSDPTSPEDSSSIRFIEPVKCSCCNVIYSDDSDKLVLCELCNEEWKCIKCMNLTDEMYEALQSCDDLTWICKYCKKFKSTCGQYVAEAVKKAMEEYTTDTESALFKMVENLETRLKKLEADSSTQEITSAVGTDAKEALNKCQGLASDLSTINKRMEMMVTEPDEIAKRKNNISISGLPEYDSFDDGTLFQLLIETMDIEPKPEPKHIRRLGQSNQGKRYMKVFLQSGDEKETIMRKAKALKKAKQDGLPFDPQRVYIGHDLTKIQREREFKIRERRRQAAARGDSRSEPAKN